MFFNENKFESKYNKKILITDFEQTSLIEGITSERLTLYFNNQVWKKTVRKTNLNKLNEPIVEYSYEEEDLRVTEKGKKKKETAFTDITQYNFKDLIKVEMEYCTIEEGCETEVFKINYKK